MADWLDDLRARYPAASQQCGRCHRRFLVLEDEIGMHECPSCGPEEEDDGEDGRDRGNHIDPDDCP